MLDESEVLAGQLALDAAHGGEAERVKRRAAQAAAVAVEWLKRSA